MKLIDETILTFEELSVANGQRVGKFKTPSGKVAHEKRDGSDWTIAEWTNAIAREVGEACNIAKKIRRGDFENENDLIHAIDALMNELADVVIYTDLVAYQVNRFLGQYVKDKFNQKSESINVEIFL